MLINGFTFYEDSQEPASPNESWAQDSARATRSLQVRDGTAARRYAAAKALLGYGERLTDVGGAGSRTYLSRAIPAGYPAVPDNLNLTGAPYLWCKSIPQAMPLGIPALPGAAAAAAYAAYRFGCEFRALPYRVRPDAEVLAQAGPLAATGGSGGLPDEGDCLRRGLALTRYVTREVIPSYRTITLKENWLLYQADPGPGPGTGQGFAATQFQSEISYTWWEVPLAAIPANALARAANAVNDAEFDGRAAGTLLFNSYSERQYTSPLGNQLLADVTYRFLYRPNRERRAGGVQRGHNAVLANIAPPLGDGLDYYIVSDTGMVAGNPKYPHEPFGMDALFRPDQ